MSPGEAGSPTRLTMEAVRAKMLAANESASLSTPKVPLPRRQTPMPAPSRARPSRIGAAPASPATAGPSSQPSRETQSQGESYIPPAPVPSSDGKNPEKKSAVITCNGWSVSKLRANHPNFREVQRVSALDLAEMEQALKAYDELGEPLIIQDWHKLPSWRGKIMSLEWMMENMRDKEIHVRNVHNGKDTPMSFSQFIAASRAQEPYHVPGETARFYWKDAECPAEWREWLLGALPPQILPGCQDDLLRHLYPSEAVESLLCYLGIGDTYTPAHKDLCASSGHNLMCFAENDGSSFWFMTATNAAADAAQYFQQQLCSELDWETHVTTVEELAKAPFTVYVAEQKVGDLVFVPSRSVHQVVNRGGLAMKTSWSRMTLKDLKTALQSELPIYRRVCRPEQYRVKTVLYRALVDHSDGLQDILAPKIQGTSSQKEACALVDLDYSSSQDSPRSSPTPDTSQPQLNKSDLANRIQTLLKLFDEVLREEYSSRHSSLEHIFTDNSSTGWSLTSSPSRSSRIRIAPPSSHDSKDQDQDQRISCNMACDFCGADIFQSFFECRKCRAVEQERPKAEILPGDGLLVCPGCYIEGRSCVCEIMEPMQCRPFEVLLQDRNRAYKLAAEVIPPRKAQIGYNKNIVHMNESAIYEGGKKLCIFEAACTLRNIRTETYPEKKDLVRRCRGETISKGTSHKIRFIEGLNCSLCHGSRCFPHLLRMGSHCAEAILAHRKSNEAWHELHKENASANKEKTLELYDVKGTKVKQRLLVAARSFPWCKPGHSHMQIGWYDQEREVPTSDDDNLHTPQKRTIGLESDNMPSQATRNSGSPLTPLNSSFNSPAKLDDEVISISDSDSEGNALGHVMRPNLAYVQVPASSSLRKRSKSGSSVVRSERASPNWSDDHVEESYGSALVSALSRSQTDAPIFTQASLKERSSTRKSRRVISPDPDENPDGDTAPLVQASATVPVVPGLHVVDEDIVMSTTPPPSLQLSRTAIRRPEPAEYPEGSTLNPIPTATSSQPSTSMKRKRSEPKSGPPGIRNADLGLMAHKKPLDKRKAPKRVRLESEGSKEIETRLDEPAPDPPVTYFSKSTVIIDKPVSEHVADDAQATPRAIPTSVTTKDIPPGPQSRPGSTKASTPAAPPPAVSSLAAPPPGGSYPARNFDVPPGREHKGALVNAMRTLTETMYADLIAPQATNPALEEVEKLQGQMTAICEQFQTILLQHGATEMQIEEIKKAQDRFDNVHKKEREERAHTASHIRELDHKVSAHQTFLSDEVIEKKVQAAVEERVKIIMPQLYEMAKQVVEDTLRQQPVVYQEHRTFLLSHNPEPGPSVPRLPQPDGGRQYPVPPQFPNGVREPQTMPPYAGPPPWQQHPPVPPPNNHRGQWHGPHRGEHRNDSNLRTYGRNHGHRPPVNNGNSDVPNFNNWGSRSQSRPHQPSYNSYQRGEPSGQGRSRSPSADRRLRSRSRDQRDSDKSDSSHGRRKASRSPARQDGGSFGGNGNGGHVIDQWPGPSKRSRSPDMQKDLSLAYPETESTPPPPRRTAERSEDGPSWSIAHVDSDDRDDRFSTGGVAAVSPVDSFPPSPDKMRSHADVQESSLAEADANDNRPASANTQSRAATASAPIAPRALRRASNPKNSRPLRQ